MSNTINITSADVNGKTVELVSGKANFGHPKYYEFTPAHMSAAGNEVDSRFSTMGFFRNEDGETVKIRLNLWGEEAELAKKVLMESERVATIMVKNAKLTHYTDRFGTPRSSASINFKSQYEVLEVKEHSKGFGDFLNDAEDVVDAQWQPAALPAGEDTAPF